MDNERMLKKFILLPAFLVFLLTFYCYNARAIERENNQKTRINTASNNTELPYAPGEVIIKLKEDGQQQTLFSQSYSQRIARQNDLLSELKSRHHLKNGKPVFSGLHNRLRKKNMSLEQLEVLKPRKTSNVLMNKLQNGQKTDLLPIHMLKTDRKDIPDLCKELATDPNVAYAEPNYIYKAQMIPDDFYHNTKPDLNGNYSWGQPYEDLWGIKNMQCSQAWDTAQGENVVVAVIDTGVDYNHLDLAGNPPQVPSNMWTNQAEIAGNNIDDDENGYPDDIRGWNFAYMNNDPMDDYGHGTHCAGTIAAIGNNGIGVIGVAPKAKIMPVKGLSANGNGSVYTLAQCIYYAVDNGADVLSCSWGGEGSSQFLTDAFNYAYANGCVSVAAAGNSNDNVQYYSPANIDTVIAVAAVNQDNEKCDFSNYGAKIAISAPGGDSATGDGNNLLGRNILSLRSDNNGKPLDMYGDGKCIVGNKYYRARGTSMACPHIAGLAALLISKSKIHSQDTILDLIKRGAVNIDSVNPGYAGRLGSGVVNANQSMLLTPNTPPDQGVVVLKSSGNNIYPGEEGSIIVLLKNLSGQNVFNVGATLTTNAPGVIIKQDHAIFGDIGLGKIRSNASNPFKISLDPSISFDYKIDFVLTLTGDNEYNQTRNFSLNVPLVHIIEPENNSVLNYPFATVSVKWRRPASLPPQFYFPSKLYIDYSSLVFPAPVVINSKEATGVYTFEKKYIAFGTHSIAIGAYKKRGSGGIDIYVPESKNTIFVNQLFNTPQVMINNIADGTTISYGRPLTINAYWAKPGSGGSISGTAVWIEYPYAVTLLIDDQPDPEASLTLEDFDGIAGTMSLLSYAFININPPGSHTIQIKTTLYGMPDHGLDFFRYYYSQLIHLNVLQRETWINLTGAAYKSQNSLFGFDIKGTVGFFDTAKHIIQVGVMDNLGNFIPLTSNVVMTGVDKFQMTNSKPFSLPVGSTEVIARILDRANPSNIIAESNRLTLKEFELNFEAPYLRHFDNRCVLFARGVADNPLDEYQLELGVIKNSSGGQPQYKYLASSTQINGPYIETRCGRFYFDTDIPEDSKKAVIRVVLKSNPAIILKEVQADLIATKDVWVASVSKNGNGTVNNPFNSIQYAINSLGGAAGTVHVLKGVYKESVTLKDNVYIVGEDQKYTIIDGGLSVWPLLMANNSMIKKMTVLSRYHNDAPPGPIGTILVVQAEGVIIEDCIIDSGASSVRPNNGIAIYDDGLKVRKPGHELLDAIIRRNVIKNHVNGLFLNIKGPYTWVESSKELLLTCSLNVTNNIFIRNDCGVMTWCNEAFAYPHPNSSIFRIQDNTLLIKNNTIDGYANSVMGIDIQNTFKNGTGLGVPGIVVKNNIVVNSYVKGSYFIRLLDVNNKYFYDHDVGPYNFVNKDGDPLFVKSLSGAKPEDYHLQEGSPAIDAGDPNDSYYLEPAPNGGRIDCGVYGNTPEAGGPMSNLAPQAGSITPSNGSSNSGTPVDFTTTYIDANGASDIKLAYLLVNGAKDFKASFGGCYNQNVNKLYLINDAGNGWLPKGSDPVKGTGGYTPGSGNIITNSYSSLNCANTQVTPSDNILKIDWNVTFKTLFPGTRNTYLYACDNSNLNSGWVKEGTYTVNIGTLTPSNGSSNPNTATTFTATFTDAADIGYAAFRIEDPSQPGSCHVLLDNRGPNKLLYLINDAANAWLGGYAPRSQHTISNTYATLDCSQSSVSVSGDTVSMTCNIIFKNTFCGRTSAWLKTWNNQTTISSGSQKLSDWQWTVLGTRPPLAPSLTLINGVGYNYRNITTLSWNKTTTSHGSCYYIYRYDGTYAYQPPSTPPQRPYRTITGTSFTEILPADRKYHYYWVKAHNDIGDSKYSNCVYRAIPSKRRWR